MPVEISRAFSEILYKKLQKEYVTLSCLNSGAIERRGIGKGFLGIMIRIITKPDRTYDYNFDDCENFFRAKIFSTSFTDVDLSVLREIDHAELLDRHTGAIQTDFGITSIDYLSTGCKTVLTYLYILRNANNYDGKRMQTLFWRGIQNECKIDI